MTFTQRERLIYHMAIALSMHTKDGARGENQVKRQISMMLVNRCRKLSDNDVVQIFHDMGEEAMLSDSVYDMALNGDLQK